jgi:hypothetical protein
MLKRNKNFQMPLDLSLEYLVKKELYQTIENGVIYQIPYALLDSLKQDFRYNHSVEEWYNKLDRIDKKKVIRPNVNNEEFYTDGGFIED